MPFGADVSFYSEITGYTQFNVALFLTLSLATTAPSPAVPRPELTCAGLRFLAGGRAPPRRDPSVRRRAAQRRSMAPRARGHSVGNKAAADSPNRPLALLR